ncbi:MAG: carboxypeptidase [Candidatus Fermentithermobacillus carboniphilus]|uniref:Carboxypeptidase n=1 Tax=Candidatus Fermentithermobacillus carboniphilus TaxID=3085328 RepID=A0AAT9LE50_9FIRM|nr:MAG: carboxypeptidase [Candidatus Fermentithermobacillus carboniphilus]
MNKPDFTKYMDYGELTSALEDLVKENPGLSKMYSIGKTYEGRDMWLVELTNFAKGNPDEKPGMYIDGNHHAGEVTGSAVCLYTIWYLLSNYGEDPFVTELLDEKTFYVLPRISIDGAEIFLHTPLSLRSSTRPYPPRDREEGLVPEDIDGDGWILQMRVKDPDGDWKVSDKDPRLMVKRQPWDKEGPFYKVYPEGIIKNWDGGEIRVAPPKWGLDINRNYPANWEPEANQRGSGPYPLSEPETRNVADFILAHPNIGGAMSYHTTMGAILRPSCTKPDEKLPALDVAIYKTIGQKGTELTGYPHVSTYEDYTTDKAHPLKGVFMDWLYEHMGIITFSTELWDASVRAGNKLFDRQSRSSEEGQLNLLKWNDRELAGKAFSPWKKFNHPQLGEVEIGGWKSKFTLMNPPPQFLEGECHKNCLFTLYHASCLPKLAIEKVLAEKLSDGLYKVTVTVKNKGYMPTNVSQQAIAAGRAKPVIVEIEGSSLQIVAGKAREDIGHLDGLASVGRSYFGWAGEPAPSRKKEVQWVVKGQDGMVVRVKASSPRAGVAEATIRLGE